MDNIQIITNGSKISVLIEDVAEKPLDYNTGEWITVVNKSRLKREKRKKKNEKMSKMENLKNLRAMKIEERKNVNLWYDSNSWEYKVLTNKYKFNDGSSVVEKYNLEELVQMYSKAKSNYKKNGITRKMLGILTKSEWENIKNDVQEIVEDKILASE